MFKRAARPVIEPTLDMCLEFLQARVRPQVGPFVCLLNLADDLFFEVADRGAKLNKKPLRGLLTQAAQNLGYIVDSIDVLDCAYADTRSLVRRK